MTIKKWLKTDYQDTLAQINELEAEWKRDGSKQRRNWWDVLAGGADGAPVVIGGCQFPVLRAAQQRKGLPITSAAISRNLNEEASGFRFGRWQKKQLVAATSDLRGKARPSSGRAGNRRRAS